MSEGWKRPLQVTWSKSPVQAGILDPIALGYVQGWRLPSLSEQPAPGLSHPHKPEVLPDGQIDCSDLLCAPFFSHQ